MRIFITKPDALGDQIIAAGFVQQLKRTYPEAQIVWHVRAGMEIIESVADNLTVFHASTMVPPQEEAERLSKAPSDQIIVLPYHTNPFADWDNTTWGHIYWMRDFLSSQPWDLAIAPLRNRNWLSDLAMQFSKAKRRIGFEKGPAWQSLAESLAHSLKIDDSVFTEEIPSNQSESEYIKLAELFSLAMGKQADVESISIKPDLLKSPKDKAALIAPGVGEHAERAWPLEKWLEVATILRVQGWSIRWIEGPGDTQALQHIKKSENEVLRFGPGDLSRLASNLSEVSLLLCNDTSYVHLAAALDTPTVAVFGCGQGSRFFPKRGRVKIVQGRSIEENSQWHNFIDIWSSIRELPTEAIEQAVYSLLEESNYDPVFVDIPLDGTENPEVQLHDTLIARYQEIYWESWSRLQLLKESNLSLLELHKKLGTPEEHLE